MDTLLQMYGEYRQWISLILSILILLAILYMKRRHKKELQEERSKREYIESTIVEEREKERRVISDLKKRLIEERDSLRIELSKQKEESNPNINFYHKIIDDIVYIISSPLVAKREGHVYYTFDTTKTKGVMVSTRQGNKKVMEPAEVGYLVPKYGFLPKDQLVPLIKEVEANLIANRTVSSSEILMKYITK